MANIPEFINFSDYRYNSFSNTITPKLIGYGANPAEERIIPTAAPYIIILHEAPQLNIPSTTEITDNTTSTVLEEVSKTTVPAINQYRVNYDERGLGQVEFNAFQKGHSVSIKYYGEGSVNKIANYRATLNALAQTEIINVSTVTTLTVSETTADTLILSDPSDSRVDINLFALTGNAGIKIRVKNITDGITRILPAGTDTIDNGVSNVSELSIFQKGDWIELTATENEWDCKYVSRIRTNFVNCSDWTSRNLGTVDINITGSSNPLAYEIGELVEDTTGTIGRILNIQDSGGGAGIITVYQVENGGNFSNGDTLTGQNTLETATINGDTKNVDSNFYHGTGLNLGDYQIKLIVSSEDGYFSGTPDTSNGTFQVFNGGGVNISGNEYGISIEQTDNNYIEIQSADTGFFRIANGFGQIIDAEDWYYNIFWERRV